MPNAVEMILNDHKKVRSMFQEYKKASAPKKKQQIAEEVFKNLEVHEEIEEKVFYKAVREKLDQQKEVSESLEEHHVVDLLIKELRKLSPEDQSFDAKFTVLMENVEHHMKEEEDGMLKQAREAMSQDELSNYGEQMAGIKKEAGMAA